MCKTTIQGLYAIDKLLEVMVIFQKKILLLMVIQEILFLEDTYLKIFLKKFIIKSNNILSEALFNKHFEKRTTYGNLLAI